MKLKRVRLNRKSAGSGNQIVPTALSPGYVQNTKYKENFDAEWVLDHEKGVARLKNPSAHLTNYTVNLQPMLGCIAVAPPGHQAFRTGYLGSYGGNLDYNQLREGTTVYLPVFAHGALLFVGDGHAAQGDGELTGDALEPPCRSSSQSTSSKENPPATPGLKMTSTYVPRDWQLPFRRAPDRDHGISQLVTT